MLPTSTIINSPPELTDQQKQLLLALVGRVTSLEGQSYPDMFTGNVETGITTTYQESDGTVDLELSRWVVQVQLLDDDTALAVEDGVGGYRLFIPEAVNRWKLTSFKTFVTTVSSSGLPLFQMYNVTDSVDMLDTGSTIDASEKTSYSAATKEIVDTSNNLIQTGDELRIDCDTAGTGTKGAGFIAVFEKQ